MPLLFAVALTACGGGSSSGGQDPGPDPPPPPPPPSWPPTIPLLPNWQTPACSSVAGPPVATMLVSDSDTVLTNDEELTVSPESRTQSIVSPLLWGGRVFAARGISVYHSFDGGCTWDHMFDAPEPLNLVAQTYPWYAFGIGERGDTLHVLATGSATFDLPFHTIDIAPALFSTLHALTSDGRIMRLEFDVFEQDSWQLVGLVPINSTPRFIAVNPGSSYLEPAHIVLSMESGPPAVTFDSGETWVSASGISGGADAVRTGRAHFSDQLSPLGFTDMDIWIAVERTHTDPDSGDTVNERTIARSIDGGRSFLDVVNDDGAVVIIDDALFEQRLLFSQQNIPGEVWFPGGGCPDLEPRLFHYQAADDSVSIVTLDTEAILGIESIHSLVVSPFSDDGPKFIYYLGHRAVDTCD